MLYQSPKYLKLQQLFHPISDGGNGNLNFYVYEYDLSKERCEDMIKYGNRFEIALWLKEQGYEYVLGSDRVFMKEGGFGKVRVVVDEKDSPTN